MRLSIEKIQGLTIVGAGGDVIGEITSLFVDSQTWTVESIQVKLRNEVADQVGARRSLFQSGSLEIPVGMIQSVGDTVVLSVAMGELHKALPHQSEHAAGS